jgi:signal transduction histidine kinase
MYYSVMGARIAKSAGIAESRNARSPTALSGRRLVLARAGWLLVAVLSISLFLGSIPGYYHSLHSLADLNGGSAAVRANLEAQGISTDFYATFLFSIRAAAAVVWVVVGLVIFLRRSDDWMALFTSLTLITFATFYLYDGCVALSARHPALWLPINLLAFLGSVSFALFFYLFPDGRIVPRWARWLLIVWIAHEAPYHFLPGSILDTERSFPLIDFVADLTLLSVGIGAQVYRYVRVSDWVQRQQTKWVVLGTVSSVIGLIGLTIVYESSKTFTEFGSPYAFVLLAGIRGFLLLIPLSIGLAILRHQLWNVDVVINRTLVYVGLTASVLAIYALIVAILESLLQTHNDMPGSPLVSLFAAGCIAVLFAPLRQGLQGGVNRLMYGERDNPYGVLSRLGRRLEAALEPRTVLPTIVETVAGALKLPYVAIAVRREDRFEVAAAHGSPTGDETTFPLNYAGDTIGQLILSPRTQGETFSSADRRLVEDLARQAEVAVHAVRLNADLQRSRERLVNAREEERRRLRRDLHDGLGPTLATLSLGLDVSLKMLGNDPQEAESLLRQLKGETQDAVVDIRRLVYGLRPPALDDLGLIPAIREQASKHGRLVDDSAALVAREASGKGKLHFSVVAPENLPPLPAAVEVACYRIVQEAITNVVRHSEGSSCRVRLSIDDANERLELEITDDGVGIPEGRRAGVGTNSMVERAAELGGTCTVSSGPDGGTRVLARLPLFAEEEEEHKR